MDQQFVPFDRKALYGVSRRNLPHWAQEACTYFVTFHTADSLPQEKLRRLVEEKRLFLKAHPKPWSRETSRRYAKFHERVQRWLDAGYGECPFRDPPLCRTMVETLLHFDDVRYIMDRFVVMPNHVHSLVKPLRPFELEDILHSWKSFSANQLNRQRGRSGRFWFEESFDHIVRDWPNLQKFRRYIERNPLKAGLSDGQLRVGTGIGLLK